MTGKMNSTNVQMIHWGFVMLQECAVFRSVAENFAVFLTVGSATTKTPRSPVKDLEGP